MLVAVTRRACGLIDVPRFYSQNRHHDWTGRQGALTSGPKAQVEAAHEGRRAVAPRRWMLSGRRVKLTASLFVRRLFNTISEAVAVHECR